MLWMSGHWKSCFFWGVHIPATSRQTPELPELKRNEAGNGAPTRTSSPYLDFATGLDGSSLHLQDRRPCDERRGLGSPKGIAGADKGDEDEGSGEHTLDRAERDRFGSRQGRKGRNRRRKYRDGQT